MVGGGGIPVAKETGQLCTAGEEGCWPLMAGKVRSGDWYTPTACFLPSCAFGILSCSFPVGTLSVPLVSEWSFWGSSGLFVIKPNRRMHMAEEKETQGPEPLLP